MPLEPMNVLDSFSRAKRNRQAGSLRPRFGLQKLLKTQNSKLKTQFSSLRLRRPSSLSTLHSSLFNNHLIHRLQANLSVEEEFFLVKRLVTLVHIAVIIGEYRSERNAIAAKLSGICAAAC